MALCIAKRFARRSSQLAAAQTARGIATGPIKVTLPDLPYDYNELEPVLTAEILKVHHAKHHQTYVNNYNNLMDQFLEAQQKKDHVKMNDLMPALRFNSGGHINHSIYWTNLAPPKKGGGGEPEGELRKAIEKEFGTFENFKNVVSAKTAAIQGSGWGWVGYNKEQKRVGFVTTPNQELCTSTGMVPLLALDVWEHAYYLKYKNLRPDYLKAMWDIINWQNVAQRFKDAQK